MAKQTIVEKAAEDVGYGLAMAEDVAGTVKTAIGTAMTTMTSALKRAPARKTAKKAVTRKAAKKAPPKKVAKKAPVRKTAPGKLTKKAARKPTKQAARPRR